MNIPIIFPNFQNCARCEKDLRDNEYNSLHLGRNYVLIFVLGHYLFLVAHRFPRATFSENCSLPGAHHQEPATTPYYGHGVLTDRSIFSLNLSRIQIPTGTSVTNCNHKHGLILRCRHDVGMFT